MFSSDCSHLETAYRSCLTKQALEEAVRNTTPRRAKLKQDEQRFLRFVVEELVAVFNQREVRNAA